MKVVHLSTSDMGGAGIAAKRLHLGLLEKGLSSKFVTLYTYGEKIKEHTRFSETISDSYLKKVISRVQSSLHYRMPYLFRDNNSFLTNKPGGFDHFSHPSGIINLHESSLITDADLIHLHWVSDGMLDYQSFFKDLNKPVVWTLHDMNPFTGGCHHSDGSMEFTTNCINCIQVKNTSDELIAAKNLTVKINAMKHLDTEQVTIVTPSQWLGDLSKQSILFKNYTHEVIPNIVDENIFKPADKLTIRNEFNIPGNAKVVLFVANDISNPRKGISMLINAINSLDLQELLICTVGKKLTGGEVNKNLLEFGFIASTEQMAKIYAMSDVYVLPSMAENFPNSIIESFFCGIPVVASRVGGIPEQVNKNNGILFDKNNESELREALRNILTRPGEFNSKTIRDEAVMKFGSKQLVEKYLEIYRRYLHK